MNPSSVVEISRQRAPRRKRTRVRGLGTLFRRGRIFWMELHWKGERVRKSLETDDRQTALIRLDAETSAIHAGAVPKTFDPITVQTMYDAWILLKETNCKASTVEDYKSRWNTRMKPFFGKLFATQVTRDVITQYLHQRMKEGVGICARNRERAILHMIFNHNREKIPADYFPSFPPKQSERALVRKGRMADKDYEAFYKRLDDDPKLFWLKAFLVLTFKYGFRKSELLNARCDYFDPKNATFTLPAFTTKSKEARVVDLVPDGEIFKMLVTLTEGRPGDAPLLTRNGKRVSDFRGEWAKQTEGMKGGSGKHGITVHDLRRSAITNMSEKGITASQAGTHLTADVFARYIVRTQEERRQTAALIES